MRSVASTGVTAKRTVLSSTVAALAAALAALTWWVAFRTGVGHRADVQGLTALAAIRDSRLHYPAEAFATLCNTAPYAVLASGVVAAAFTFRGLRAAILTGVVIVVPNAVSQALKVLTAEDRVFGADTPVLHVSAASWPSGHATASLTLALCAVAIAPAPARRAVAVLGLLFAGAVGLAVVGLGWHFPSDVIGGYLVAICGFALAAGLPERLVRPVRLPGEDEQQVAQPVQVAHGLGADRVPAGDGAPLGPPAHGPTHVQLGAGRRSTG